jgi:formylglycine-generating enzyme required for sulfatase activity
VTIKRGFGLGVREVTVAEFQLFVASTGYRSTAELAGESSIYNEAAGRLSKRSGVYWKHDFKGREAQLDMPVLHVSAIDAQAYVDWLANETGKRYRLPSEAEYEYVARAGGNGNYWWGQGSPAEAVENLTGERDRSTSKRQWSSYFEKYGDGHWGPAPVGSLTSDTLVHPMGVQDIAGNVSEWTADCWHENYVQAPTDGSAWFNPGCERRVVRGGYWASAPEQSRAAYRIPVRAQSYGPVIGFRVARDL